MAWLFLLLWLGSVPAWSDGAPFSLTADKKELPYRLYSGDELIGSFATKEEVDAAAINAVLKCTKDVNYVYTETVAAVNSQCGVGATSAPAANSKTAPAAVTPTETKAADKVTPPPETKEAPAGKLPTDKEAPSRKVDPDPLSKIE